MQAASALEWSGTVGKEIIFELPDFRILEFSNLKIKGFTTEAPRRREWRVRQFNRGFGRGFRLVRLAWFLCRGLGRGFVGRV
jgi:hypothetical protein